MTAPKTVDSVSRRTALTGIGAGGLALALAVRGSDASAQEAAPVDLSAHPLAGTWLVTTTGGPRPNMAVWHPDGSFITGWETSYVDPALGVVFESPAVGTWEPMGERQIHFTAVFVITDADGTYLRSVTFEGHPMASEDGQTFRDDTPQRVIVRDAGNNVISDGVVPVDGVTGTRMTPSSVTFPPTSVLATPSP